MRAPCPRRCEGKQKPGRDCRPSGRSSTNRVRAALFSDLFNVVASRPAKSPRRRKGISVPARRRQVVARTRPSYWLALHVQAFAFPCRRLYHLPRLGNPRLEAIRTALMAIAIPQPKPGILEIDAYVPGESKLPAGIKPIKLSSNETPLGPSPKAIAAFKEVAGELERYPDGSATLLRAAIAARYGLEPGAHRLRRGLRRDPDAAGARLSRRRR